MLIADKKNGERIFRRLGSLVGSESAFSDVNESLSIDFSGLWIRSIESSSLITLAQRMRGGGEENQGEDHQ